MDELRKQLDAHEEQQHQLELQHKQAKRNSLIEKLAGKRHHLLGTQSNPGIYTQTSVKKHIPPGPHNAVIIRIPESQILDNDILKAWIQQNIKNSKLFMKKFGKHHVMEDEEPESVEKTAQGPFLVSFPRYKVLAFSLYNSIQDIIIRHNT